MLSRVFRATMVGWALGAPYSIAAQTTSLTVESTVTFMVPVNLTQLSPDLEKVRAVCMITSNALNPSAPVGGAFSAAALIPQDELPVAGGQLVTTMRVLFAIYTGWLLDPVGKPADYQCGIQGYSKSFQRWDFFSDTATDPAFRLKPTPAVITGSFVW